ncbi:SU10 major capsid protein [Pseudoxanthomonas beigongshangi]
MPTNTLITPSVVKVKEDVIDQIYNFNPSDAPLVSMIERTTIDNVYFEWQRDTYRTPDQTRGAIEGADASYAAQVEPTLLNNRSQIFQDTVSVSNTAERVRKYGRDNESRRLRMKKMVELKRDQEAACIASGATVTGTDAVAGKQRGLYGFITNDRLGAGGVSPDPTTNTAPVAGTLAAFSEDDLKTGLQTAYQNGGDGSVVLCSPAHKVRISGFTGGVQRTNEVGGRQAAVLNAAFDFYRGDFGVTKVIPNRVQAGSTAGLKNTVYIIDADKLGLAVLRGFESEQLATVGDAKNWQVRTETSLVVRDEKPLYAIRDATDSGA